MTGLTLTDALKARLHALAKLQDVLATLKRATAMYEQGQLAPEQAHDAINSAREAQRNYRDANTQVVETLRAGGIGPLAQHEGVVIFGEDTPDMPKDVVPWIENGAVRYFVSQPIFMQPKSKRGLKKHPPDFDIARVVLIAVDHDNFPHVEAALEALFPDSDPFTAGGAKKTKQAETGRKRIRRRVNDLVGKTPGGWSRRA